MFASSIMSGDTPAPQNDPLPAPTPAPTPTPAPAVDPVAPPSEDPPAPAPEPKPEPKDDPKPALEVPAKVTPKTGDEPKPEPKDDINLEEEDETEEAFGAKIEKLSKTEVNKLARKAFKQRGDAFRLAKSLKKKAEAHDALMAEKGELEKKILAIQDAPETKAQQAALAAKEAELQKLDEEIKGSRAKIDEDRKYVEGLQMAHDVQKTQDWQTFVEEPATELMRDIDMVATSIGEDDDSDDIKASILAALKIPDENERWRALKIAGKDLSPADQARLAEIFKGHKTIAKNRDILTGQSDVARKAIQESREKKTAAEKAAQTKEYHDGVKLSRETFAQEFPWVKEDFDASKFPPTFQDVIARTKKFANEIDMNTLTPAQLAKVGQGYAYFQGASILAREYAAELEKELKANQGELQAFRDAKAAKEKEEADAAAKLAENKGKLTPSSAPKKPIVTAPSGTPRQSIQSPVQTVGTSFAAMVAKGQ